MKNKVSQFNPQPLTLMHVSIDPSIRNALFTECILSALRSSRQSVKRRFNARILRQGANALLELSVISGVAPLKPTITHLCKLLRDEGIDIDGVDGWHTPCNDIGTGATFVLSFVENFDDVDCRKEVVNV